ncbi:mechanosensitive ion channel family protein [Euhalothece natronophila Z-M001]|uniref:Mechanosensitive ion channel family protein n=1 Tax=Euhalothece natronophila Z-M001 TaxID=522448 RepID=A0A5B8NPW4_9CHRO|nr:mechanosensitive ion channel family protein [Euhalothece natronophila]QDZ41342.1 mechanosensitive ion channel family protein [Euhalothece natronophila Z-M001]
MDILETLQQTLGLDLDIRGELLEFATRLGWFVGLTLLAWLIAGILPFCLQWSVNRFLPKFLREPYERIVKPLRLLIVRSGFLAITAYNINFFEPYSGLYEFLRLIVYLPLTVIVAVLLSRLVRQTVRLYGVKILQNFNRNMDDFLLIGESIANVMIGFFAVIFFAQSQNINLLSLLTGVSIGGVAVAFAAKEILSQVVGTVLLYLDRPFVPGEYIRANFNFMDEDIYGRVEAIGIRSTKIRLVAKNTLLIAPNSLMARMDVENVSRGKKVMVLFYLDFLHTLNEREKALVYQVIEDSLNKELSDVDSSSTQVALFQKEDQQTTRVRISLFVKGSSEKSIVIRKRLIELANESLKKRLQAENLQFEFTEPTIYIDEPMTL